MRRIALTLLALPPAIVAVALLALGLVGHRSFNAPIGAALSLLFFYALFLYASVAFVAIPLLVILARRGRVTASSSTLIGAASALSIPGALAAVQLWNSKLHLAYRLEQVLDLWPFALVGAVSGLVFWFLALWRNPLVARWNTRSVSPAARGAA